MRVDADVRCAVVPEWIIDDATLTDAAVRLYAVLAADYGLAWPSIKVLATRMRRSESIIRRALRELEAAGAVGVTSRPPSQGDGETDLYTLRWTHP